MSTSRCKSRVTKHSTLTVVSSKPIGSGTSHPLSALDHAMGLHTLHIIFYYKDYHNLLGSFELDPLRESLCQVLTLYPNMTGRLVREHHGNWEVSYNDAGVRVTKANVDVTLHEWLTSASGSQESLLMAWEDMPHDPITWSPFRIQINVFEGGGFAIGVSCSHMLADLTSLASFVKSWTEAQRHLPITHPPFFTMPLPSTNAKSREPMSPSTTSQTAPLKNMDTATFSFSNSIMEKCLSQVRHSCPNATPFDFLSSLFWTRVTRLKPPKTPDQTHSLSICTDFRSLMKTPCPVSYFGNASHFSMLLVKGKDMDSVGLGGIASLVHDHLEGLEEGEVWSNTEWFESQMETANRGKFRVASCMYGSELTCVCMEHMIVSSDESLMYSAMFSNNEKPVHVSCHVGNVNGEGLMMVMPSLEGGHARRVMVMLPQEQLAELRKDQAILQLDPTVLLADD